MKRRLIILVAAIALGIMLMLPAVAFAGGDQVHRPDESPQFQAAGEEPLGYQLQTSQ